MCPTHTCISMAVNLQRTFVEVESINYMQERVGRHRSNFLIFHTNLMIVHISYVDSQCPPQAMTSNADWEGHGLGEACNHIKAQFPCQY